MSSCVTSVPPETVKSPKPKAQQARQTKRKVRSNPSSPRSSTTVAPRVANKQSPPATPPKSPELTGAIGVLGKERDLVPYFPNDDPEGNRNLCELGGKPKPRAIKHRATAPAALTSTTPMSPSPKTAMSPKLLSTTPTTTTTTQHHQQQHQQQSTKGCRASPSKTSSMPSIRLGNHSSDDDNREFRHQYAGPAFSNSPAPDCLPPPSFLEDKDSDVVVVVGESRSSSSLSSLSSSSSPLLMCLMSPSLSPCVSRELVFDDAVAVNELRPRSFSFAEFSAAFPHPASLSQPYSPIAFSHHHQQQANVLAEPTAHLKRLLNISVA